MDYISLLPIPNPASGELGGAGSATSANINVNPVSDPALTLDPSQAGTNGVLGVNQIVAWAADNNANVLASLWELRYSPLYKYPL